MNGIKLTVLYTLHDRLARDAEDLGGFLHGDISLWDLRYKAIAQFLGDADLPRCARCDLLAGNEPVVQPTVQRRRGDAQYVGGLCVPGMGMILWGASPLYIIWEDVILTPLKVLADGKARKGDRPAERSPSANL